MVNDDLVEKTGSLNKRRRFDPKSKEPFKISRTKIDMFLQCPRCFYLDRVLGISQPPGPPFTLNVAVDHLLKKEFDIHRAKNRPHPLMAKYGIVAVPLRHKNLEDWRNNFVGIQYLHRPTNLLIFGAIDDVWENEQGEYHIVDYKATAKAGEVELTNEGFHAVYKRQMEIYQWLFRQKGFPVSSLGYFVYVNGKKDREAFDGRLEFDVKIIPYQGRDVWVETTINDLYQCLTAAKLPQPNPACEFCLYRQAAREIEK